MGAGQPPGLALEHARRRVRRRRFEWVFDRQAPPRAAGRVRGRTSPGRRHPAARPPTRCSSWDGGAGAGLDRPFGPSHRRHVRPRRLRRLGVRATPWVRRGDPRTATSVDLSDRRSGERSSGGQPRDRGDRRLEAGGRHGRGRLSASSPTDAGLMVGAGAPVTGDPIAGGRGRAAAEVAVVMVGTDADWETEGEDRPIDLPGDQDDWCSGRRGQPEHGGGGQRRVAGDDAVARRRGRGAAGVVPGRGVRQGSRRHAARRRRTRGRCR